MINETIYQCKNDYSTIPKSIKNEPIFLLYKTFPKKSGKLDKIPYQANGRAASSTDPATWCTFHEAVEAYQTGTFAGIGVILVPPLCCVDLDNLRDKSTGELHPIAKDIVKRIPGWAEISVSETGVHIFGYCDTVFGHTQHKWVDDEGNVRAVEIFQDKRFMALTGRLIEGSSDELDGLTDQITGVYNEYIALHYKRDSDVKPYEPFSDIVIDIDERLKLAYQSKTGQKIRQLMAGDLTEHGNDHSSADAALATHLAYWLDNDHNSIEEAFSRSELANRDKWRKRPDYRYRTIQAAIGITAETYTSKKSESISTYKAVDIKQSTLKSQVDKVYDMLTNTRLSTMTIPPVEYFDYPFIMKNATTAFTGETAHGKSTFTIARLHEVANKHPNAMVIYCDADNPASIAHERSERLRGKLEDRISYWGGFMTGADGNLVQPWGIESVDWLPLIKKIREAGKDPIIVFDTLNSFMNGQNENDNAVVGKIMNYMRSMTNLGATCIIIHHTGKSETSKESRGASAFKGGVDAGFKIESRIVDCSIQSMIVRPWKSRLGKTETYAFTVDDDGRLVQSAGKPKEDACLDFILKNQGKSRNQIETAAARSMHGFSRQLLRETIDKHLLSNPPGLKRFEDKIYGADTDVTTFKAEPLLQAAFDIETDEVD